MPVNRKNLHILVVDDDSALVDVATRMLTKLGHVVTGETGSLEALQTFSRAPYDFDIAVLDVRIDELTGLELAQRLRRIRPCFPLILYGGYIDDSIIHDAEEHGIFWFKKPATLREMETVISQASNR